MKNFFFIFEPLACHGKNLIFFTDKQKLYNTYIFNSDFYENLVEMTRHKKHFMGSFAYLLRNFFLKIYF